MSIYYLFVALVGSFFLTVFLTKIFLPILHKMKFGQQVREEGPDSHLKKQGTPTMGGVVILAAFLIGVVAVLRGDLPKILPILILTIGFGIIGFLDDYIKIVKKRSLGLTAWQKLLLQVFVTGFFCFVTMNQNSDITTIFVPFSGKIWNLGALFIPFAFFAVLGTVNGANFTDGLDGLLGSVTFLILCFFGVLTIMTRAENDYALLLAVFVMGGVLLGFLMFNIHPAKLFMGDTGSLALGGFVAALAFMTKTPLFILLIAIIYLVEILSVVLQVSYFKLTKGKRIFKMSPLHHHFELCGMEETRVVFLFSVVTLFMGMLAIYAL